MNKKAFILLLLVFYILSKSLLLNKYGIITKDGVIYACLSERFLDQGPSGLLDVTFPPLYPFSAGIGAFLLKPLYQFFPQTGKYFNSFELGGILASSFFHILLCLAVYRAGKKLYGFNVAAWASLFMLFHPLLFRFSGEVLTETIFAFLIFCGSYLMFLKDEPSFFSTFSSASCFGLSYYVKPEGIVVGILFFIVLVFQKKGFREKPLKPFLFLISLAMLSAPYVIYLSKETGQVLLSNKQNIVFYLSVKRMFPEMQSLEPTGVIAFVTAHPLHALVKLFRGLYYTVWNLPEAFFRIYFLFF
ncbi:MAG: glycosyltransferase family 39 protein, partial [Candidatus Aureabacteria bacterium]|nr:glycosyltransferase family 39 protein [Candidatus Auribacterota bacterium]